MKPLERGGVVDSRFQLHGVSGLRVVDASVFPRIPGYFLVSAVYMIAEKAADVMLEQCPPCAFHPGGGNSDYSNGSAPMPDTAERTNLTTILSAVFAVAAERGLMKTIRPRV